MTELNQPIMLECYFQRSRCRTFIYSNSKNEGLHCIVVEGYNNFVEKFSCTARNCNCIYLVAW